jgi:hypothetical protein
MANVGKLELAYKVLRTSGVGWVAYRLKHSAQHKLGVLARGLPVSTWDAQPLRKFLRRDVPSSSKEYAEWREQHGGRLFSPSLSDVREALSALTKDSVPVAENVLAGKLDLFGAGALSVGFPPDWHRNPLTGDGVDRTSHWSEVSYFGTGGIKPTWELSRFPQVLPLVRAYAQTGDEKYAEAFWQLFASWRTANPPQHGCNWKCGQETALRAITLCFGFYAFQNARATAPERIADLAATMAVHAERIAFHIDFARSQKNNHGISEGAGLWTIGLLFPEFALAPRWRELGREVLEEEAARQFYADGAYVQHSFNYQRLAMDTLVWCARLGERNRQPLSDALFRAISRSAAFLHEMVEPRTGELPNFGSNDSALLLRLSSCDIRDFRPSLQAAHYLCWGSHLFAPGPWDEALVWMFGQGAIERTLTPDLGPAPPKSFTAETSGYHTLRGEDSWALLRAPKYVDRPGHADVLHVDLWWRGQNLLCDPGTYLYDGEPGWDNELISADVHNTVTIDGSDPMLRAGLFLWLDWPEAKTQPRRVAGKNLLESITAAHDGYAKLGATHRRSVIRIAEEVWVIVDDVLGSGTHEVAVQWLVPDTPHIVTGQGIDFREWRIDWNASAPAQLDIVRAGEVIHGAPKATDRLKHRGWSSKRYAQREPAKSLRITAVATLPLRFITVLTLGEERPEITSDFVTATNWKVELDSIGATDPIRLAMHMSSGARL